MGPGVPTEEYFNRGLWGHDGGSWRKLSLLWGYSDRLAVYTQHTQVGTDPYFLSLGTVPAGEIWVVNATLSINDTTQMSQLHYVHDGSNYYYIKAFSSLAAGVWAVNDNVVYVLKEGDSVGISFWGNADGDGLTGCVWGYKMGVG